MQKIKNFINDESGMETLEYAMIAGLIAIVAIAVYGSGSTWGTNLFNNWDNPPFFATRYPHRPDTGECECPFPRTLQLP
jgi:Flp pilus assembly pilin Flp